MTATRTATMQERRERAGGARRRCGRGWARGVAGIAALCSLQACVASGVASGVAVATVPRALDVVEARWASRGGRGGVDAPRIGAGRAEVRDAARAWQRRLVPSGAAGDSGDAGGAERLRVEWRLPLQVGEGVRAFAGVADARCGRGMPTPTRWALTGEGSTAGVTTVVVDEPATSTEAGALRLLANFGGSGGDALSALDAVRVAETLGLPPTSRVTWVGMVPRPGPYVVVLTWDGVDADAARELVPCLDAWRPVDAPLHREVTRRAEVRTAAAQEPGGNADSTAVAQSLGLTGIAGPDLLRLDVEAARREGLWAVGRVGAARGTALLAGDTPVPQLVRTLRGLRAARVSQLREAGPTGRRVACQLVQRHGLGAPRQLWGGVATIPVEFLAECGAG